LSLESKVGNPMIYDLKPQGGWVDGCSFAEMMLGNLLFNLPQVLFIILVLVVVGVVFRVKETSARRKIIAILVVTYFIILAIVRFGYFRGIIPFSIEKGILWFVPTCI